MTYTKLTSNLSGRVRREKLHGREYFVAPVVMIVPGVLMGSKGPLYYPPDEIRRDPEAWNNMPLTLGHPSENGHPVSARVPKILERFAIGHVFNVRIQRQRLVGEAYFDEELCVRRAPKVWVRLLAGKPLELSTGLFTENEPTGGSYDGRGYVAIARNFRPDHLAILPDTQGACSIRDGCGVLVNRSKSDIERLIKMLKQDRGSRFRGLTRNQRDLLKPDTQREDLLIPPTLENLLANEEAEEQKSAVANERKDQDDLLISPRMTF